MDIYDDLADWMARDTAHGGPCLTPAECEETPNPRESRLQRLRCKLAEARELLQDTQEHVAWLESEITEGENAN